MNLSTAACYTGSLCFTCVLTWAAIMDISIMKIQNTLILFLLGTYVALAPLTGISTAEIGWSFAVALAVLFTTFGAFTFGWMGGGDAKLISTIALWMGVNHTLDFLAYTALFGGALSLIILQFRAIVLPYQFLRTQWITRLHDTRSGVPYGVAIAAGAIFVFPDTAWLSALE